MLCRNPRTVSTGETIPCGNCMNCRINTQKALACRITLETYFHPRSVFITLTYSDENVPMTDGVPMLHKPDVTTFLQKLRYQTQHISPLRYVAVGEYGSETWRPHYHLVVFGHGVEIEPIVNECWSVNGEQTGFTQVSEMTFDRAMYIAHYTVKKITQDNDPHLKGRLPEFSRWSKGLGLPAIGWLADTMGKSIKYPEDSLTPHGPKFGEYGPMLRLIGDVFNTVRIEGRILPLGLYLRRKLREALGLSQNARERAIQLGRFNVDTGEVYEQEIPEIWSPSADISDIKTPFRIYTEAKARAAKQSEVEKRAQKADRQSKLDLTAGNRI